MILELDKLSAREETVGVDEMVRFEDVDGNENQIHCHIEVHVQKIADSYFIHADLDGWFETSCHRCLEPAKCDIKSSFDLIVKKSDRSATAVAPKALPDDSGDESLIYLSAGENVLSLDQMIYESLVADIPMRICCSDDCKGLCPSCGKNLNKGPCDCEPEGDPRWDALRSLRRRDDAPSK